jgi:hypothetical protein
VHAAERVVGLAADRLHLLQLGGEVELVELVARRVVGSAVVDRVRDADVELGEDLVQVVLDGAAADEVPSFEEPAAVGTRCNVVPARWPRLPRKEDGRQR